MKNKIDQLAIFGATPAFDEPLHVGRPNIPDRQRLFERLNEILDRKRLTNQGPEVAEFERRICEMTGARFCAATCNGTLALEIAIRALGLSGEVIVPSFTFVATAHALQWHGIKPVFCDIDPDTFTIDPYRIEQLISDKTSAILGVHTWGRPCHIDALTEITARRRLSLLFDAAHAFGVSYRGRKIGNFGNCEIFSFHATKFINALEGGAIVTNDESIYQKARLMRNFGFAGEDRVVSLGTNAKMNEFSAAMGLSTLEMFPDIVGTNRRNCERYRNGLKGLKGIEFVEFDEREQCNYQYVIILVRSHESGLGRDRLKKILTAENVLARSYFYPGCHLMEPYRTLYPPAAHRLPVTERVSSEVLALPTGTAVGLDEIDKVCRIIRLVMDNAEEVTERFTEDPR